MLPSDPLPKSEERRLATAAAEGDSDAVGKLYDAYERRLFGYCSRIVGNPDDAADATQEAFCNVIQRLPGLDTTNLNFGAYLFTAARNACMDLLKSQGRFQATGEVPEDPFAVASIEDEPERALLTSEQQRAAREANAALPEKQRAVLAMREVAELSYDDIADALDMNQNSVAQLISRARLNFQKQLRAGSVVLAPTGADDERALQLTAARMDGQIKDDDLAWLTAHLSESRVSRVNAEAIQESAKLYRAIGPIVVVAGLRDGTLARVAGLVSGDAPTEVMQRQSAGSDQPPQVQATAGGASGNDAASTVGNSQPDEGADRKDHRKAYAAAAVAVLVLILLIAATTSGEPTGEVEAIGPRPTSATTAAGDPEPRSSKSQKGGAEKTTVQSGQPRSGAAPAQNEEKAKDTGSKKKKNDEASSEAPPSSDPPAVSNPDPPATSDPDPGTPGGSGGGFPGGPGNLCASPPCNPPAPIP